MSRILNLSSRHFMRLQSTAWKFTRSKFLRNVLIVATGTAGAQAITIAVTPIISRIYGPENYGIFGIFAAIAAIFTPFAALCYPMAIVLPKEDFVAKALGKLSLLISIVIAFLILLLILFSDEILILFPEVNSAQPYLILIPFMMVFSAALQVFQQWSFRKKLFAINARITVLNSVFVNGVKCVLGFLWSQPAVLIFSTVGGVFLHALMLGKGIAQSSGSERKPDVSVSIMEVAKTYKDFPYFRAPQSFLNPLAQSIPVLVLAGMFGPAIAGFYTLSRSVMSMPIGLIGTAIGNVFYPRIVETVHAQKSTFPLLAKATAALGLIGIVPFGIIVAFGPQLFAFVFGPEWMEAGSYARWIGLWTFFGFMNIPANVSLPAFSLNRFSLVYEVTSIIFRFCALSAALYIYKDALSGVIWFSVSGAFLNAMLISTVFWASRKYDRYNGIMP